MSDATKPPVATAEPSDGLTTWPHLVRVEFLVALAAMLVLTVWSIVLDAPLEEAANPNRTPDPSKAPWYFLGLQELLVYFDPWIAGVVVPLLIIVGLMAIPYLDRNPAGNGYFTLRQRPFAIATFLFGFLGLWIIPIVIGVFCRGPGWNWYWPWESWDVAKTVDLRNVNLTDLLGIRDATAATWLGGLLLAGWFGLGGVFWLWQRKSLALLQLGAARYAIVAFLWLSMAGIVVKMALRLALNVKYVWVSPWFSV